MRRLYALPAGRTFPVEALPEITLAEWLTVTEN
jgi:hypothetical protein